ncbi:MAG TPA: hypothetical protein VGN72_12020 [Tepidisphaeraceae bacterium]|jgi:hypothetical protein|nr:hypothetical protein [Tepidisphaeraceae bacterium]
MSSVLSRAAEIDRIVERYGDDWPGIMAMVERHFAVLHNRAQVLLTLCGIVISTTGFSGRLIAGTNVLAQALVIGGIALVLLSTAVVAHSVLHLRWLTMHAGDDTRAWLESSLAYRDYKTGSYRVALIIMVAGLCLYCGAIAIMLLYPHEGVLPAR